MFYSNYIKGGVVMSKGKIKIVKNGPYIVTGNIPLSEKTIVPKGKCYELKEVREIPHGETYALCRCGKSKNPPFCDGAHEHFNFDGTETASRKKYAERIVDVIEGPDLDLLDDGRCAYARFCHRNEGDAWSLTRNSDIPGFKEEAIIASYECPAGRLVAVDKEGREYDHEHEPSIEILQDPQKRVSGPISVKGMIPLESSDGSVYEVRNRVTLCRCGRSRNKPFCDAAHVTTGFIDRK
jgi:CDGSH-type Zn-finger protein